MHSTHTTATLNRGHLLLLVGFWVKSPEKHSGHSSEVPQKDETMGAHSIAWPNADFSSDEEIEAFKRLSKYLTAINKNTRTLTQGPPSRTVSSFCTFNRNQRELILILMTALSLLNTCRDLSLWLSVCYYFNSHVNPMRRILLKPF